MRRTLLGSPTNGGHASGGQLCARNAFLGCECGCIVDAGCGCTAGAPILHACTLHSWPLCTHHTHAHMYMVNHTKPRDKKAADAACCQACAQRKEDATHTCGTSLVSRVAECDTTLQLQAPIHQTAHYHTQYQALGPTRRACYPLLRAERRSPSAALGASQPFMATGGAKEPLSSTACVREGVSCQGSWKNEVQVVVDLLNLWGAVRQKSITRHSREHKAV
jgi:hypothetical protein